MGRLYPWGLHAPKVLLEAGARLAARIGAKNLTSTYDLINATR